jgi:hypothetical protein
LAPINTCRGDFESLSSPVASAKQQRCIGFSHKKKKKKRKEKKKKKKKKKERKEEGSHAANNVTEPSTCRSKETLSLDARKEGRLSVLCPRTCS